MILNNSRPKFAPNNDIGSIPSANKAAIPREPSDAELATEFKVDDSLLNEPSGEPPSTPELPKKTGSEPSKTEDKSGVPSAQIQLPPKAEDKKLEDKPAVTANGDHRPAADRLSGLIMPGSAKLVERDYTGFTPEEQSVLRAMSNEAFAYTTKLIKEHKEAQKHKDNSYLQHPQAYTLSPEYTKLQEDAYFQQREFKHWQEQLALAAEGREWREITGWDKNNQPVYGKVMPATTEHVEQMRLLVSEYYRKIQETNGQLQSYSNNFKQQLTYDQQVIQQECAKRFGWCADPKLLDSVVDVGDGKQFSVKQIREDFINLFPGYMRNTPGIEIAAHTWAALQIYGEELRKLKSVSAAGDIKRKEKEEVEPTSKAHRTEEAKPTSWGEIKEFSVEGMPV